MEDMVVWDGTGSYPDVKPVTEWLKANGVDPSEIPMHSTVSVDGGQIVYTRLVSTLDNKVRVTEKDEPAMESASAPVTVAWPLEVTA